MSCLRRTCTGNMRRKCEHSVEIGISKCNNSILLLYINYYHCYSVCMKWTSGNLMHLLLPDSGYSIYSCTFKGSIVGWVFSASYYKIYVIFNDCSLPFRFLKAICGNTIDGKCWPLSIIFCFSMESHQGGISDSSLQHIWQSSSRINDPMRRGDSQEIDS